MRLLTSPDLRKFPLEQEWPWPVVIYAERVAFFAGVIFLVLLCAAVFSSHAAPVALTRFLAIAGLVVVGARAVTMHLLRIAAKRMGEETHDAVDELLQLYRDTEETADSPDREKRLKQITELIASCRSFESRVEAFVTPWGGSIRVLSAVLKDESKAFTALSEAK